MSVLTYLTPSQMKLATRNRLSAFRLATLVLIYLVIQQRDSVISCIFLLLCFAFYFTRNLSDFLYSRSSANYRNLQFIFCFYKTALCYIYERPCKLWQNLFLVVGVGVQPGVELEILKIFILSIVIFDNSLKTNNYVMEKYSVLLKQCLFIDLLYYSQLSFYEQTCDCFLLNNFI